MFILGCLARSLSSCSHPPLPATAYRPPSCLYVPPPQITFIVVYLLFQMSTKFHYTRQLKPEKFTHHSKWRAGRDPSLSERGSLLGACPLHVTPQHPLY